MTLDSWVTTTMPAHISSHQESPGLLEETFLMHLLPISLHLSLSFSLSLSISLVLLSLSLHPHLLSIPISLFLTRFSFSILDIISCSLRTGAREEESLCCYTHKARLHARVPRRSPNRRSLAGLLNIVIGSSVVRSKTRWGPPMTQDDISLKQKSHIGNKMGCPVSHCLHYLENPSSVSSAVRGHTITRLMGFGWCSTSLSLSQFRGSIFSVFWWNIFWPVKALRLMICSIYF